MADPKNTTPKPLTVRELGEIVQAMLAGDSLRTPRVAELCARLGATVSNGGKKDAE